MSARRGGLGRGLGALIPTAPPTGEPAAPDPVGPTGAPAPPGTHLAELPVGAIRPNARQPRQVFDEDALAELVVSLREVGMLQPVVVRPVAPAGGGEDAADYELVMGERRWRAAVQAGLTHVPAIVRTTTDDAMLRDALLENLHRAQLNPLEEAAAYQQLLAEFGTTHEQLATSIGRSRSQVTNTIRLLGLPAGVQRRVAAGVLSAGHARALLAHPDPSAAEALAGRIVAEGLSVRSVEEIVAVGEGRHGAPGARTRRARTSNPVADELAERLGERLETRVHIELARSKGRLVIEVADLADLTRVVNIILDSGSASD